MYNYPCRLIQKCQSGECTLDEVYRKMGMTTSTETAVRQLKGVKRKESSFGKVDFVIYPNVMLVNNVTYKLYKAALELQPAWKCNYGKELRYGCRFLCLL